MTADRTRCEHCGFVVVSGPECPLCGHDLDSDGSTPSTLWTLFGG